VAIDVKFIIHERGPIFSATDITAPRGVIGQDGERHIEDDGHLERVRAKHIRVRN
jgi:hypothetical protein